MSITRKTRSENNTSGKRASLKAVRSVGKPVGLLGDIPASYQQLADGVIDYIRNNPGIAEVLEKLGEMYGHANKAYYLAEATRGPSALIKSGKTRKTPSSPGGKEGRRREKPGKSSSVVEGLKKWASAFGIPVETDVREPLDIEDEGEDEDVEPELNYELGELWVVANKLTYRIKEWASSFIDKDILERKWPPRNDVEKLAVDVLDTLREIRDVARELENSIKNEQVSAQDMNTIKELVSMVDQAVAKILDLAKFSVINYFERYHPEALPQ